MDSTLGIRITSAGVDRANAWREALRGQPDPRREREVRFWRLRWPVCG
jgi:hypothetical protein